MTCPNNAKICFHPAEGDTYRDIVRDTVVLAGLTIGKDLVDRAHELLRSIHTPTHAFERFASELEVLAAKRTLEIK